MVRRTLVIGGTRNLGPELVLALFERGDDVTVLNRGITPNDLPAEVSRLIADRGDAAALTESLGSRSFDLVVDTTLYNGADAEAVARCLRDRVGRFVFWSTGQVYLVREGLAPPFVEDDYPGRLIAEPSRENEYDSTNWLYGIDKRGAEDALRAAFERHGFPYVALRMPMIHSPRDHHGRLAAYVHRLLDGGPILVPDDPDPPPLRHVYGSDVVAATLAAGEPAIPTGTCLNISQDESLTLKAFLRIIGRLLQMPPRIAHVPRAVLESRGLMPACSPCSGRWMSVLSNERSRALLGLRFTPPEEYLPPLVEIARRAPAPDAPGYLRRPEELTLA